MRRLKDCVQIKKVIKEQIKTVRNACLKLLLDAATFVPVVSFRSFRS